METFLGFAIVAFGQVMLLGIVTGLVFLLTRKHPAIWHIATSNLSDLPRILYRRYREARQTKVEVVSTRDAD